MGAYGRICVGHCEHWAVSMLGHLFLLITKPDPLHWIRLSDFWGSTHRHTFYLLQRLISLSWMLLVSPSLNSPGLAHSHIRDGPDMMVYDTLQGKNLTFHSSRQPFWLILWHSGQRTHFSTRICCPKNRAAAHLYYSACHGTQHQRLWASEKVSLWWVWVPPQATCSSDSPVPPSFSCLLSHKLTKEKLSSTSRTSKPNILDLKYKPILQWFHHYHLVSNSSVHIKT